MKLVFIREKHTPFGGAENYLQRLTNQLTKDEHPYEIINSPFKVFLPSWIRVILFNLYLCIRKRNNIYFSLERIVCADIYRAGDGVHKVFLTKVSKSKFNPLHKIYEFVEKKCFDNSNMIIANSEMVKKEIIDNYEISESKIEVIYNGIELMKNKGNDGKDSQFFIDYEIAKFEATFLFVGNGFDRKGLSEFIDIISTLSDFNLQGLVIGHDKNIEKYVEYSLSLGLERRLLFLGERKDVDKFYSIADFVILPTKYDPFSNVILEAMQFSNIVITTRQNGASEIINKEWVMDSCKDMEIVKNIKRALLNKEFMDDAKTRNYNIVKNYSIEENTKRTLDLIMKLYPNE